jgi:hypothetical protein
MKTETKLLSIPSVRGLPQHADKHRPQSPVLHRRSGPPEVAFGLMVRSGGGPSG